MGIMNHNAVVATTWNNDEVQRILKWVNTLPPFWKTLFLFGPQTINNVTTIILVPDGSKEGWDESNEGNSLREDFIKEIEKSNYEDGSNPWEFVEVGFGEYGQKVLKGNNKNCYDDREYAE